MGRRRFLKFALLTAAALFAAGVIALSVIIDRTATGPGLKPRIEEAASNFLGRPVTIETLEWRRWPAAMLVGTDVRLYEDPLKRRLMVDAPIVEARVAALSILKLAAGITELRFVSPRIFLRRDKSGEWNAVRIADEISARPDEPGRKWGSLAFNWFAIEGGTVTVEDEAGALSSLPPFDVRGRGKLRFGRRHVHFPFDLEARLQRSRTALKINGDLGGHAKLSVDVKNAEPSLARFAWPPAARWGGEASASLRYDEHPPLHWDLHVRAEPLIVSTEAPKIDLLEATGHYIPSSSATFSVVARSSASEIDLKGSFSNGALAVDVKSPSADLTTLRAFAGAAQTGGGAADLPDWKLSASISADDLRYQAIELRAVRAVVSRSTGPFTLEHLTLETLGGTVEANGSYRPKAGDDSLRFAWKTTGIDVHDLFRLAGSTRDAGGIADSEGSLVTGTGARFLPALTGTIKLDLKNGWTAMPGLLKALSRLNLSTLFSEVEGRHRSNIPYDEAHAAVTITKGKAATDRPIVLKNKTLEMAFMGTYDLPSRTIDGRLVVNVLTVTDEIIGLIPGVRSILLDKGKGMIPIWMSVKGKVEDPEIQVLSAKTIAGPFWNPIKRVLSLPKTLFDELKK